MNGIECAFTGRLGQAPELRTSQAGKPWARFSVAVAEAENAQWVNVACFGEIAERAVERLAKGDRCYVEGAIRLNKWNDREGKPRTGLQVAAWKVEPMGQIGQRKPAKPKASARDHQRPADADTRPARQMYSHMPAREDDPIPFAPEVR